MPEQEDAVFRCRRLNREINMTINVMVDDIRLTVYTYHRDRPTDQI